MGGTKSGIINFGSFSGTGKYSYLFLITLKLWLYVCLTVISEIWKFHTSTLKLHKHTLCGPLHLRWGHDRHMCCSPCPFRGLRLKGGHGRVPGRAAPEPEGQRSRRERRRSSLPLLPTLQPSHPPLHSSWWAHLRQGLLKTVVLAIVMVLFFGKLWAMTTMQSMMPLVVSKICCLNREELIERGNHLEKRILPLLVPPTFGTTFNQPHVFIRFSFNSSKFLYFLY